MSKGGMLFTQLLFSRQSHGFHWLKPALGWISLLLDWMVSCNYMCACMFSKTAFLHHWPGHARSQIEYRNNVSIVYARVIEWWLPGNGGLEKRGRSNLCCVSGMAAGGGQGRRRGDGNVLCFVWEGSSQMYIPNKMHQAYTSNSCTALYCIYLIHQ